MAIKRYFDYFPYSKVNDSRKKFKKVCEDEENQKKRMEARFAIIKERGLSEGCSIRLKNGKGKVRILKTITEYGFIFLEGSNIQQNPQEWELA